MTDLEELSLDELRKLRKDVDNAIKNYGDRKKQKALAEVEAFARERGLSPSDLGGIGKRRSRKPAKPKYAHPDNPEQTWSGRGRRPRWLDEALAKGRTLEDLAV